VRRSAAAIAVGCAALLVGGCGGDADGGPPPSGERPGDRAAPSGERPARPPRVAAPRLARCPPGLANCRTATGRILYVERVDPDGDGDAHLVLASREAITLPGVSVIDVKESLRPRPLPARGDRVSAAGPVYRGSYGQRQIEAIELHVAR
jgi:hypothetical protein